MIPDSWDIELRQNAQTLARLLLQTGAVRYDPECPARHGSGLVSPMHVEGRLLLAYPSARRATVELSLRMIDQEIGMGEIDAIAAFEGASVPFATLIAQRLSLPLVFVRKENPSGCSYKDAIEGPIAPGMRVLPVDQLITDGHRKPRFIQPLKQAGCRVDDVFVLFQYGIFDVIHENLARLGVTVHALCTWWDLLEAADADHYLDERARAEIHAFLNNPSRWTDQREGSRAVA